jgi:MFS family permease
LQDPGTRRNVVALGLDHALFLVGMTFASQQTVLPAFAAHLGAPNVVIGAIPAVMTAGWSLPSLFAAGHTETLARKLPFMLRYTGWERLPLLALGLVAFLVADRAPGVAVVLMLGLLLMMTTVGGILMPAWMDVLARAIPTTLLGRFFAASHFVAGAGGLLASGATAWVLATLPPPQSFGVCFVAGAACVGLSWLALLRAREPAGGGTSPPVPLGQYLRRVPGILRRDRDLAVLLAARTAGIASATAVGFYTVFALRIHGAADWHVGVFTALLVLGLMGGTLVFGWLADRTGHRPVLLAGATASAAGNLVAVLAPSLPSFSLAFLLAGLNLGAVSISARTVLLEFAPTAAERPTYVGLGNTALAPASFGGPLLAGALADALGFTAVFAGAAACGLAGLGLTARVRDPRRRGA